MREILFRGKAIDDNWYYGVPLVFTEDYVCMTAPHTYNKSVIPETVGQYTGLTDKNGKRIFEGDIVKYPYHATVDLIVFYDGAFGYLHNKEKVANAYNFCSFNDSEYGLVASLSEVIGNIHDNPELLM